MLDEGTLILNIIHHANDGYGNGPLTVRALDEQGFIIVRKGLHQSLRRMVSAFRDENIISINSHADEQIAAHAEAKALAYPKGHLRDV